MPAVFIFECRQRKLTAVRAAADCVGGGAVGASLIIEGRSNVSLNADNANLRLCARRSRVIRARLSASGSVLILLE